MSIEFRKMLEPRVCINNSFTLAGYILDMNGLGFPLCENCSRELLKEISSIISFRENVDTYE